jgi:hypothetical protein
MRIFGLEIWHLATLATLATGTVIHSEAGSGQRNDRQHFKEPEIFALSPSFNADISKVKIKLIKVTGVARWFVFEPKIKPNPNLGKFRRAFEW